MGVLTRPSCQSSPGCCALRASSVRFSRYDLLRKARGLTGRRQRQFRAPKHARRIAEFINDFAVLRTLSAFNRLEATIGQSVYEHGWNR